MFVEWVSIINPLLEFSVLVILSLRTSAGGDIPASLTEMLEGFGAAGSSKRIV